MQKLRVLVSQVSDRLPPQQSTFDGQLYINGAKADLDMPLRYANIPANAKLEVKAGMPSSISKEDV